MKTKLTISLDKEIIKQTKKYAADKGKSLSEIVENYFKYITDSKAEGEKEQLSPRVRKLRGVLKVDSSFNYKEILSETKNAKHGV